MPASPTHSVSLLCFACCLWLLRRAGVRLDPPGIVAAAGDLYADTTSLHALFGTMGTRSADNGTFPFLARSRRDDIARHYVFNVQPNAVSSNSLHGLLRREELADVALQLALRYTTRKSSDWGRLAVHVGVQTVYNAKRISI